MENKTERGKNRLIIVAILLLMVALFIQGTWITVWYIDSLDTPEKKMEFFLALFPSFMQNIYTLSFTAFLTAGTSFVLGALSLGKVMKNLKWLSYTVIAASFVTGFLSLFQMM
jgi:hypothetical protein